LARLPGKFIQEPWKATLDEQKAANVIIGEDYPAPIVNHGEARDLALEAYRAIRR
jgi:deoxyribodipyrimidine photo-lyase